jgi:hypothetical protein
MVLPVLVVGCGSERETTSAGGSPPTVGATTPNANRNAFTQRPAHHGHQTVHRTSSGSRGGDCRAPNDVLAGVYHPERLRVLAPCRIAAGSVVRVRHEPDGDLHIDVALDAAYSSLIDEVNRSERDGALVVEFMARDGGHLPTPAVGDHIRLTGAWVDDTDHGWNELHPVWSVQINGRAVSRSGPQYGGSPASARSYDAAEGCRDQNGAPCQGYEGSSSATYGPRGGVRPSQEHPSSSPGSSSSAPNSASFCGTHRCIPSFSEGTGTIVQCADGEWSHSGGRPGVCSRHGGPKE